MKKASQMIAAVLTFMAPASTHAALIAYDGFDYAGPAGTSVSGLNGGTGWTEAYPAPSGTIALDSGLNFPGLTTVGFSMEYSTNANLTTDGRNFSPSVADGVYWYSLLVQPEISGANRGRGIFNALQRTGDNQNGFGFRLDNDGLTNGTLNFKAHTSPQTTGTNINVSYGQTLFVLGKITYSAAGSTTSDLWVYDSAAGIPATMPATPMSTVTIATGGAVNGAISGRAFSNSGPIVYDEIRIGTDFADVVPVPEPSAALLGSIAILGLAARRRR